MTKETKIGLLVGLTFIILFAIILSEKGATNNVMQPSNLLVTNSAPNGSGNRPGGATALDGVGNLPTNAVSPISASEGAPSTTNVVLVEREVGNRIPRNEDEILPLPESVVHRLNVAPMPEREVQVADVGSRPLETVPLMDAVNQAKHAAPNSGERLVIHRAEESTSFRAGGNSNRSIEATRPPPVVKTEPVRIIATHEVKSGESLSKIAARYYGRSTPARINAIFDVNRDRLTSLHSVRVGDTLRIPAIPDAGGVAFVDAPDFAPARIPRDRRNERDDEIRIPLPPDLSTPRKAGESSEPAPPRSPAKFDWYIVKENDTLSGIAKREMGSARLYLVLYEANRDILPNKNTLKPGMKIRIPAQEQVSSAVVGRQ